MKCIYFFKSYLLINNFSFIESYILFIIQRLMKQQLRNRFQLARKNIAGSSTFPRTFKEELNTMEEQIKNHHSIKNIWQCCSNRKINKSIVDYRFIQAFKSMSYKQKVQFYEKTIQYANQREQQNILELISTQNQQIKILQQAGFHSWRSTIANLNNFKIQIRDGPNIDSRNFIMRKSNREAELCYAFQSINKVQPTRYRFKYANQQDQKLYHKKLVKIFQKGHYQNVRRNCHYPEQIKRARTNKSNKQKESKIVEKKSVNMTSPTARFFKQKTDFKNALDSIISKNIAENDNLKQNNYRNTNRKSIKYKTLTPIVTKTYHKNIFKEMFPGMSIQQIDRINNFKQLQVNEKLEYRILTYYSHKQQDIKCAKKLTMKSSYTPQILIKCLTNSYRLSQWHPCIKNGKVLMILDTENSMISSQINQYLPQSEEFQFFIITHCFEKNKAHYLVQKSIQFQTFQTDSNKQRGILKYALWKFQKTDSGCDISLEMFADHGQDVSPQQEIIYAKQYLKHFPLIEQKFLNSTIHQNSLNTFLQFNWCISDTEADIAKQRANDIVSQQFDVCTDLYEQSFADYYSIQSQQNSRVKIVLGQDNFCSQNQPLIQKGNILQQQIKQQRFIQPKSKILNQDQSSQKMKLFNETKTQQTPSSFVETFFIKLNSQGLITVENAYLNHKFKLQPYSNEMQYEFQKKQFEHPTLKDDFRLNHQGQMVLINADKLGKISQVMAFLTKKLFNNLLGGKSILNISLPVIICAKDSNLQRISKAWKFAPIFLEQATKTTSFVERFKFAIAFKLGYAVSYVNIQKPFNPILGQTYQAWIKGCPIYAEQISHHPPITSLLFYGRGYKISSTLQVKVQVKLNSGKGFNQGLTKIEFDDGQTIFVTYPKGEVSGLVMGNKKFTFYQFTLVFDIQNRLYMQLLFEQKLGTFQKKKWKERCQIQGKILKTTNKFMNQFVKSKYTKRISKQDIQETLHTVSGKWLIQLLVDGKKYFDVYQDRAYEVKQEPYPLPSHSNFRQDLYYRKLDDERSQIQKQKLEQLQRYDRKLRDKHQ